MNKLDEIFETKRMEVERSKLEVPLVELERRCAGMPPTRGFKSALKLSSHPVSLIAEVKARSPSQGTIRADFDPASIARQYECSGADCLSVLTDRSYFGGDPANIQSCKDASSLPVLRKDFIEDEYQVFESRAWGADAVLLIVAALSGEQIRILSGLAMRLGMDVLVEVHNETEVDIALDSGNELIGVNNRDLSSFETDLAVSERLLPLLSGRLAVSESALGSFDDVERVRIAGARSVLIGTTFCASPDIANSVAEVMGWPRK